ncbi:hypothetical protein [Streptomyces sp. KM273126]|uniref:hypothetical protein n=1 Tax=Streptomyces sp. KM273126 TaxID=2545247 RepID=UPI00268A9799|nr:hypothetical protein [Streptomyces sp. KM273126]
MEQPETAAPEAVRTPPARRSDRDPLLVPAGRHLARALLPRHRPAHFIAGAWILGVVTLAVFGPRTRAARMAAPVTQVNEKAGARPPAPPGQPTPPTQLAAGARFG